MVVEDDNDGEALVLFSYIQFCLVTLISIQLHVISFSSVLFNRLTTQLEAVDTSELMEGAYLQCGR